MTDHEPGNGLFLSLLDEPLISYRRVPDGAAIQASLPELFVALAQDEVRDFPALRPHQRHPWHAFLVQLAAIALHRTGVDVPFESASAWRSALLELTPDDPDGAAWCLVTPVHRPALFQPADSSAELSKWGQVEAADELDMLITSRNHDLKRQRARACDPENWLYALVSLQTQEGYGGRDNFGVARMAGGFGTRPAVAIRTSGHVGAQWSYATKVWLSERQRLVSEVGYASEDGLSLLWLAPWDGQGNTQIALSSLDPFFIEVCRRVRLASRGDRTVYALTTTSKKALVDVGDRQGCTGDIWTPVDVLAKPFGAALKVRALGFDYRTTCSVLFGTTTGGKGYEKSYLQPPALAHGLNAAKESAHVLFQAISRGGSQGNKSVTEGYHQRLVVVSPKARGLLAGQQKAVLGKLAARRIALVNEVRSVLWSALVALFSNGAPGKDASDSVKDKAGDFARVFEQGEDARFFVDLNEEIEADDQGRQHLQWQLGLVDRAEAVLKQAFVAGPRSAMQRYRAQAAALSRFHGTLKGPKSPLPEFLLHHKEMANAKREEEHDLG